MVFEVEQRRFDPSVLFGENCEKTVYACQIKTYEAG
jgi:hypothetical protein